MYGFGNYLKQEHKKHLPSKSFHLY